MPAPAQERCDLEITAVVCRGGCSLLRGDGLPRAAGARPWEGSSPVWGRDPSRAGAGQQCRARLCRAMPQHGPCWPGVCVPSARARAGGGVRSPGEEGPRVWEWSLEGSAPHPAACRRAATDVPWGWGDGFWSLPPLGLCHCRPKGSAPHCTWGSAPHCPWGSPTPARGPAQPRAPLQAKATVPPPALMLSPQICKYFMQSPWPTSGNYVIRGNLSPCETGVSAWPPCWGEGLEKGSLRQKREAKGGCSPGGSRGCQEL